MSYGKSQTRVETPCPYCKDDRQTERIPDGTWFCNTCGRTWVDHLTPTVRRSGGRKMFSYRRGVNQPGVTREFCHMPKFRQMTRNTAGRGWAGVSP